MRRKNSLILIILGIISILFSLLTDTLGFGQNGEILGAKQILGIEFGIALIIIGIGLYTVKNENRTKITPKEIFAKILDLPVLFWVLLTFLILYLLFFIPPLFFSEIRIQYFVKYIPDAWTTRIGFDIDTTLKHINAWLTEGTSLYADGIVPYTPLTLALFTPFLLLGYPVYYKALSLLTIFSYFLATFLFPLALSKKKEYGILILLGVSGLFSYGFQFELERGQFNIIAFALVLFAIYIFHYQHKFRYFAYLFFSLALQLKLYPAIFILMLVKDWRDWKNNLKRFIALGIANFLLLFVLGVEIFNDFIAQIINRANMQSSRYEDLSISGFSYYLSEEAKIISPQTADLIGKVFLFFLAIAIFAIIVHLYRQDKKGINPYLFLILTIAALMIPAASFDYKLTVLIVPMILFFNSLPTLQTLPKKLALTFTVLLTSAAYWSTLYPYEVKMPFLARNSLALLVILFALGFLYLLLKGRYENIRDS